MDVVIDGSKTYDIVCVRVWSWAGGLKRAVASSCEAGPAGHVVGRMVVGSAYLSSRSGDCRVLDMLKVNMVRVMVVVERHTWMGRARREGGRS